MKRLGGWWRLWIVLTALRGIVIDGWVIATLPAKSNYEKRHLNADEMKLLSKSTINLLRDPEGPSADIPMGRPATKPDPLAGAACSGCAIKTRNGSRRTR